MNNLDIIKQIQEKYKEIETDVLIGYIYSLIKKEFLRYNSDERYFDNNFENILSGRKKCNNQLDYAIDQAIFIVLQPLRCDLDPKDIEQTLLNWSGYILNRNTDSGCYPKDIIHYFEGDADFDTEKILSMSENEIRKVMECDRLVDVDEKECCTKILCKRVIDLLTRKEDISDEEFNSSLAIINYRFIRIHPFEDGNGRVSRMLLNYIWNLKNGCVPIGLDNDEINGMIEIYKNIDGLVYSAFMGSYLSNLKYDIDYCLEAEALLTMDIASFLAKKQQEAKIRLGLVSDRIMK